MSRHGARAPADGRIRQHGFHARLQDAAARVGLHAQEAGQRRRQSEALRLPVDFQCHARHHGLAAQPPAGHGKVLFQHLVRG